MEKRSLEDFTCEKFTITPDIETKYLRSDARLCKVFSLLGAPVSAIFFFCYNLDYQAASISTESYVFLGSGVLAGGYSIFYLLYGIHCSRKAGRLEQKNLEQKIFEEKLEEQKDDQENNYRRQQ